MPSNNDSVVELESEQKLELKTEPGAELKYWSIDMAEVQLTISVEGDKSIALVDLALSAMKPENVFCASAIQLSVKDKNDGYELIDHADQVQWQLGKPGDLIYHLTDRIVFHLADKSKGVHCLHAAAVAKNGRAIVIPANSGAGKSTFTTWLVTQGFDYLSDELILIDAAYKLMGVARPIQIKQSGLQAIDKLVKCKDQVQPGDFATALPISCLGSEVRKMEPQALSMFIFPHYLKGAEFSFQKLSSAEAGMALMSNHVNARNIEGHGFSAMMKLVRRTPCFSLEYGGFTTLPPNFTEQLSTILIS